MHNSMIEISQSQIKNLTNYSIIEELKHNTTIQESSTYNTIQESSSPITPTDTILNQSNKITYSDSTHIITSCEYEGKSWEKLMSEFNADDDEPIIHQNIYENIDFNTYENSFDEIKKFSQEEQLKECIHCKGKLSISSGTLVCKDCGIETFNNIGGTEEEYSTSAITDCNVNSNGFMALKMTGKGSYGYQRSLLKTCANYQQYRKVSTLKDMNNWNNNSEKYHIPKNVIQQANDMFDKIKKRKIVFRKDGKKGVLSACLYYACYDNNISKTPSEIAQFSNIEEKFHSHGDRILHSLNELGIIQIPAKINPTADYINRYMELLDIDKKYKQFIIDLIDRAEEKKIHILHDSKANTRAVGAIFMLIERLPELKSRITKEIIEKECGISKTTFIRYYKILCKYYKLVKKIFKRHAIPMPNDWRK